MAEGQYYFCLTHHSVEPYDACRSDSRLGPYPSEQEAQQALEKVQQRNEAWDNDPKWNDDDDDEDAKR